MITPTRARRLARLGAALLLASGLAACDAPDPEPGSALREPTLATDDPAVANALQALDQGLPWRASRLVTPALVDTTRRGPAAILVAARAASRWGGWTQVERLLGREPWLDGHFDGEGRALLAQARLTQGDPTGALPQARRALAVARTPAERGARAVLVGRVFERLAEWDSARAMYLQARIELPELGDWLALRAAAATADSTDREALYREVDLPPARDLVPVVEAEARLAHHDTAGAIRRFETLGNRARALDLRLALARTAGDSAAVRVGLLQLLGMGVGASQVGTAVAAVDRAFPGLRPEDDLTVARAAAGAGMPDRAVAGFRRAVAAGAGTPQDRLRLGHALARLGRYPEAAEAYARVAGPPGQVAGAAYLAARSTLRGGDVAGARRALQGVLRAHPADTVAALARVLLADLAIDEGREDEARTLLREAARRFPGARLGAFAAFQAAVIAYAQGDPRAAALELDRLADAGRSAESPGDAAYWSGRAWAAAGDSGRAAARWRSLVAQGDHGYYAVLAARRLGVAPWRPDSAPDAFDAVSEVDAGMARAAALRHLGLEQEAEREYLYLSRRAHESLDRLLATAHAYRHWGHSARALQLTWSALGRGAPRDARTYRLLYPTVLESGLRQLTDDNGLSMSLVAGLIRQESAFDPRATSSAGARGLMQIMPDLGGRMAIVSRYPVWDDQLLYQPDVSLEFGTRHLRELARRHGERTVRVLAAYNAGSNRVDRWVRRAGMDDPEIFTERVPFRETRDYIRSIVRNEAMYRALYGWP